MIVLNGLEEEMKKMREAMLERRQKAKEAKMAAKVKWLDLIPIYSATPL